MVQPINFFSGNHPLLGKLLPNEIHKVINTAVSVFTCKTEEVRYFTFENPLMQSDTEACYVAIIDIKPYYEGDGDLKEASENGKLSRAIKTYMARALIHSSLALTLTPLTFEESIAVVIQVKKVI